MSRLNRNKDLNGYFEEQNEVPDAVTVQRDEPQDKKDEQQEKRRNRIKNIFIKIKDIIISKKSLEEKIIGVVEIIIKDLITFVFSMFEGENVLGKIISTMFSNG